MQDLRFALRTLVIRKAFTVVVVVCLGLGRTDAAHRVPAVQRAAHRSAQLHRGRRVPVGGRRPGELGAGWPCDARGSDRSVAG